MKTKNISYMLLSSLFVISGCGSSSTSNNSSTNAAEEAVYMTPIETNTSDTSYKMNTITSGSRNSYKVTNNTLLEDAEDGTTDGWRSYDNSPSPVTISNIYDNSKKSKVINLKGVGLKNGAYFSLGNDSSSKTIKWSMNFNSDYTLYVRLNTKDGIRYIYYTPVNYNYGKSPIPYDYYIHHGLGSDSKSGTWKTFSRDLTQDLKEFEPNNDIKSIVGLYIRGSGRIDDISLLKTSIDSECVGYHNLRNKINNNEDVTHANTSCITDMSGIFTNNKTFNQDISDWDMSNVTSIAWMFNGASAFNQDISSWNLSNVTNMSGMFNHAYSFNQNVNNWNTSHVTEMDYMFTHAEAFDQDLSLWQVDNVQTHLYFSYAAEGVIEPNWEDSTQPILELLKQKNLSAYHGTLTSDDILTINKTTKLVKHKRGFIFIYVSNHTQPKLISSWTTEESYYDLAKENNSLVLSADKSKLFLVTYNTNDLVKKVIILDISNINNSNFPTLHQDIIYGNGEIELLPNGKIIYNQNYYDEYIMIYDLNKGSNILKMQGYYTKTKKKRYILSKNKTKVYMITSTKDNNTLVKFDIETLEKKSYALPNDLGLKIFNEEGKIQIKLSDDESSISIPTTSNTDYTLTL